MNLIGLPGSWKCFDDLSHPAIEIICCSTNPVRPFDRKGLIFYFLKTLIL